MSTMTKCDKCEGLTNFTNRRSYIFSVNYGDRILIHETIDLCKSCKPNYDILSGNFYTKIIALICEG